MCNVKDVFNLIIWTSIMNVDLSSVRSSPTKSKGTTGTSLDSRIAALKKKMVELFNKLKELGQEPSEESVKQAEAIQKQIELLQAQIMQLEALKRQQEKAEQKSQTADLVPTEPISIANEDTRSKLGNNIDSYG